MIHPSLEPTQLTEPRPARSVTALVQSHRAARPRPAGRGYARSSLPGCSRASLRAGYGTDVIRANHGTNR